MNISVVIPLLNEEESLEELHDWIVSVMRSNQFSYEIIFIDDGSTDGSWQIITGLSPAGERVSERMASNLHHDRRRRQRDAGRAAEGQTGGVQEAVREQAQGRGGCRR